MRFVRAPLDTRTAEHSPGAVTRLIDDERREQFLREGAHFESQYALTLTYLRPSETEQNLRGWLFEGQTCRPSAADEAFTHFKRESLILKF
jgi:type IV secretion system protein VirB4